MHRKFFILLAAVLVLLSIGSPMPAKAEPIVCEDAEDGATAGWQIYDNSPLGSAISNIYDEDRQSRVIQFAGDGTKNGYRLRNEDGSRWHDKDRFVIEWSQCYPEDFIVYAEVRTKHGTRYITYVPEQNTKADRFFKEHGLGTNLKDGQWHTYVRDIQLDLNTFWIKEDIIEVNAFLVRGNGKVDDIKLLDSFPEDLDTDGDGISDLQEMTLYNTCPYTIDSDGDGINDGPELEYWGERWNEDFDRDHIINLLDPDSDNDSVPDGQEIAQGYDPEDPQSFPPVVIYEDAEDGTTAGWHIYDNIPKGAEIGNVYDDEKSSRVIELKGACINNGYYLWKNELEVKWRNRNHFVIKWNQKYAENFFIYIDVMTTRGPKYLYYTPVDNDMLGNGRYIHHGLGVSAKDGQWHTCVRDLRADFADSRPNAEILEVNGFLIRGSGRVDDIMLMTSVTPVPEISFSVDPVSIVRGETCTLNWSTDYADNVSIDQGIGEVDVVGTLEVTPSGTTTYTLTASNSAGSASANVTVEILSPPLPTATLTADPLEIVAGQKSMLTWESTNAQSCVIEPGLGTVEPNGSIDISPLATTTYTITGTGSRGTATDSETVNVTYLPPLVFLTADPQQIQIGETSILIWTSDYADTCTIEPGIGAVEVNGSITVSPSVTTTYTITATGTGGTATDNITVTVAAVVPIMLEITSPFNGEIVSMPDIMVQGTVTNDQGGETGVNVNGISTVAYGGQFAANHVFLQEGENIITVTATDVKGETVSASITVYAEKAEYYIRLTADSCSGIAPFETTLTVEGSFIFLNPSITYTSPGAVEYIDKPNENEYTVRMATRGIYYFTAEVTYENIIYTDTIAIEVMDEEELDALLKTKWGEMKAALAYQDIQSALGYFTASTKELYNEIYKAIYDNLPQFAQDMQDIELIYAEDNLAKYRIRKNELYGGQNWIITYYIFFEKDEYGLWKIYRY